MESSSFSIFRKMDSALDLCPSLLRAWPVDGQHDKDSKLQGHSDATIRDHYLAVSVLHVLPASEEPV